MVEAFLYLLSILELVKLKAWGCLGWRVLRWGWGGGSFAEWSA